MRFRRSELRAAVSADLQVEVRDQDIIVTDLDLIPGQTNHVLDIDRGPIVRINEDCRIAAAHFLCARRIDPLIRKELISREDGGLHTFGMRGDLESLDKVPPTLEEALQLKEKGNVKTSSTV